jgi:hypothetical protein
MGRNTVFSQRTQLICRYRFKKSVDAYHEDRYTKLLFAQSKGLDSLRDIAISLRSHQTQWYHLGLTSVARRTLSDANNKRDAGISSVSSMILWQNAGNYLPGMGSSSRTRSIRSIRRSSTSACHCIPGRRTGRRKARSSSTPCSTMGRRSWFSQTAKRTT